MRNKKILIIASVILTCITITLINLMPNDYWWHVKAGEYIYNTGTIPFTDVFSWYGIENNLYWHSHEWLTEVLLYLISMFSGNFGVLIFIAFCLSSLFLIIYFCNKKLYEEHYLFSFLWILIGISVFFFFISPRPHMISFVLFAVCINILLKYRANENYKYIWLLPLISFIWVNFHGGSSNLPYVLCIIFIVTGLFEFKYGKLKFDKLSPKQLKTYFMVGGFSFLALVLNPHGLDMISYPYANMNDTVMLSFIGEWQSPNIKNISEIAFILPIVVSVLIFIKTKKEILFIDLTLIGAFSYLTLKSLRFSAFIYIVASFIIFNYIKDKTTIKFNKKIFNEIPNLLPFVAQRLYITLIITTSLLLIISLGTNSIDNPFERDIIPNSIIESVKTENPTQLFNDYNLGGYLIYNDIKPLIDGRADMYSKTLLKDYVSYVFHLNKTLEERYDFDYYLILKDSLMHNYLKDKDNMKLIKEEGGVVFFKNTSFKEK